MPTAWPGLRPILFFILYPQSLDGLCYSCAIRSELAANFSFPLKIWQMCPLKFTRGQKLQFSAVFPTPDPIGRRPLRNNAIVSEPGNNLICADYWAIFSIKPGTDWSTELFEIPWLKETTPKFAKT